MSYLPDKKNNRKNILLTVVGIAVFLGSIFYTFFPTFLGNTVAPLAAQAWRTNNSIANGFNSMRAVFLSKTSLHDENERLKEELRVANLQLLDRVFLQKENIELKELLDIRLPDVDIVLATVLARPNKTLYDTLVIDINKESNIEMGDEVIYGDSVILGKIDEIYSSSAKVTLFSSPGIETDVMVGKNHLFTTAVGRGGGDFELHLPRGVDIEVGDVVFTASVPRHIVGVVEYVQAKPSDPFKTFLVKNPVNLFMLKWVEVVLSDTERSISSEDEVSTVVDESL